MKNNWYMLTVIGKDRPGIVAEITTELYKEGCYLGEASMIRLGGDFTIMIMVQYQGNVQNLKDYLDPVAKKMSLHLHFDKTQGHLHDHRSPDVHITVYGADKPGIVAKVTTELNAVGLDIFNLESVVGGSKEKPVYIMQIEGYADNGVEILGQAIEKLTNKEIEVRLDTIDTMVG